MGRWPINWIRPPENDDEVLQVAERFRRILECIPCLADKRAPTLCGKCDGEDGDPITAVAVHRAKPVHTATIYCTVCWELELIAGCENTPIAVIHLGKEQCDE